MATAVEARMRTCDVDDTTREEGKPVFGGFRPDTNQSVQSQTMAGSLKFRI